MHDGSSLQELDIEVPHNMHVHYSKGSPEVSIKQLLYANIIINMTLYLYTRCRYMYTICTIKLAQ